MSSLRETSVIIVGGGPVGLLSALLLARQGIPCVVFEQRDGISTHPKAMGITRRTAEVFRELGLLKKMREEDFSTPETQLIIWAKSLVGEELGRAPLPPGNSPLSPCAPFHSPQPHTESVLLAAVEAEPLASVHYASRISGCRELPHGVDLDVEMPKGSVTWRAEWVIAADGAASPMRRMLGVEADGPGDLGHFLNVFFHADLGAALEGRHALLYNILREDAVEFFVSVNGRDLWLMHHFLDAGTEGEHLDAAKVSGVIRDAAGIPDLRVTVLRTAQWVMSPKVAAKFREGRVFFVGDAAARLSPAGGLGMNTGLQSAHNLAWKLAAVIHGTAEPGLLDSYEQERQGVSRSVMRHTNEGSGEIFRQIDCALHGDFDGVRRLVAESTRREEDSAYDTGVRYGEMSRLPHGWLIHGDRRISSLDLVGGRFVVLAGPDAMLVAPDLPEVIRPARFDDADFPERAGFGKSGAILVRPDGFVAWKKSADATDDDVRAAYRAARR